MMNRIKTGTKSSCLRIPPSDQTCVKEMLTKETLQMRKINRNSSIQSFYGAMITVKHAPSPLDSDWSCFNRRQNGKSRHT